MTDGHQRVKRLYATQYGTFFGFASKLVEPCWRCAQGQTVVHSCPAFEEVNPRVE